MSKLPAQIPQTFLLFISQVCFLWALSVRAAKCPETLLPGGTFNCGDPLTINPILASTSTAYFTTPTSVMSFHWKSVVDDCLNPTPTLFTITIGASERQIYRLFLNGPQIGSEVAHGGGMKTLSVGSPFGNAYGFIFEAIISINLATGEISNLIATAENIIYKSDSFTSNSAWRFDSSTKLFFGSAPGGTSTAENYLDFMNLRVFPTYFTSKKEMQKLLFLVYGLSPLRRYKMDVIGGSVLSDTATSSPVDANLGTPPDSPTWIGGGNPGLEFTANQYVDVPIFFFPEYWPTTFSFWFRSETLPLTSGYIFQGYDQLSTSLFISLELLTDGNLRTGFPSFFLGTTTTPVPLATWTLITVSYIVTVDLMSIVIYYGPTMVNIWSYKVAIPPTTLDPFHIGGPNGFTGKITDFSIYQEGSLLVAESCEGAGSYCNLQLGQETSNPTCLNYDCDSNCIQCTPIGCLCSLPNRLVNEVCTCGAPDSTYSDGTNCHLCPDHCATCSGARTCLTCEAGFGFSKGLCVSCSSGVVFDDDSCRRDLYKFFDDVRLENLRGISSPIVDSVRLIMEGKGAAISAGLILDMVSNIKYFNISYSPKLQEILNSWNPDSDPIFLEIPMSEVMQDDFPQEPLPYAFAKYFLPSSFLVNFWSCFISVLILAAVVISVRILESTFRSVFKEGIVYLAFRRLRLFLQNYLIAQAYSVFGEIICYSGLGFRTATFTSAAAVFSFLMAILCIIAVFSVFYFHFWVLRKYQKIKNTKKAESLEKFKEQNAGNKLFFDDLKDESMIQQSYLLILVIREFIFYLMLTILPTHPIAQNIINLVINLLIVTYLVVIRPFEKTMDVIHQYTFEFALLNINACLIINALLDDSNTQAISILGYYIIVVNIIMNILVFTLMPIQAFLHLREQYHLYKEWRGKRKVAPIPVISTPNSFMMSSISHSPDSQMGLSMVKPRKFIRKVSPAEQDGTYEESPFTFKSTTQNNHTEMTMPTMTSKKRKDNVFLFDEVTTSNHGEDKKKYRHHKVFETEF